MRWLPVRSLVPTSLLLSAACLAGNTNGPSSDDRTSPKRVLSGTDTLAVESDAYLGPDGDDYWKGTTDSLVVDGVRSTRVLIRVNQDEIEEAIGSGTLASATLELTVQTAGASWPTGGATVDAHRVLQHWTEAEVTWVCADGHEAWDMSTGSGSIWHAAHTARTTITNGQTGVVRLNVTADVAAFLSAPPSNHGWLIKRTAEGIGEPGRIAFASRETVPQPRLIIEVESDTARPEVPNQGPQIATNLTVAAPDGAGSYHRNVLHITFQDSTSGPTVRDILQRYSATIIGGVVRPADEDDYIVQVPDPGLTWAALEALIQQIGSEPGVLRVGAATANAYLKIRGRYPEDGAFSTRADWFRVPATVGTQPRLAIRAPLAWGCETGLYGPNRPRVAVADLLFDWQHEDFEGSTVQFQALPAGTARVLSAALTDPTDGPYNRAHGTGVAGVLAATGDNSRGIAGMVWGSDLYLYAMAEGQEEAQQLDIRLEQILQAVNANGVRIFVTSLAFGRSADTALVARVRTAFRPYLLSGGIVVIPTGNDGVFRSLANVATSTDSLVRATDRALAQLYPTYANQIIFVAGTNRSQTFWSAGAGKTSNMWLDASAIAAPAELVLTLGIRAEPDNLPGAPFGTRLFSGTSFAAPHVAGVAALLRAMEPSLTAAEVKSYILRGAQEPKQDPATGFLPLAADSVLRRVQGAPGPLYQLDAYGSLTLLSRERQGTPLCGVELFKRRVSVSPDVYNLTANRQAPEVLVSGAPVGLGGLSVAQGGRLLAMGNRVYRFSAGAWGFRETLPTQQVVFLERDTAYARALVTEQETGRTDLLVRMNGDPERNLTVGLRGGLAGAGWTLTPASFSPAGDYVHVSWFWDNDGSLDPTEGGGTYLMPLRTASPPITLSQYELFMSGVIVGLREFGVVAWRRDGGELMRAMTSTFDSYNLQRYQVSGSIALISSGPSLPGQVHHFEWAPEGGRLTLREVDNEECTLAVRRVESPHALIEPALTLNPEACSWRPQVAPLRDRLTSMLRAESRGSGVSSVRAN